MDEFEKWLEEYIQEVDWQDLNSSEVAAEIQYKYETMTCKIEWEGLGSDCFKCSYCGDRTWEHSPGSYCTNCGRKVAT